MVKHLFLLFAQTREIKISITSIIVKAKDLLLIDKFVRRMKGSKRKIVPGQILEKAANLGPYVVC